MIDNLTYEQIASNKPGGKLFTACNATPGTGIAQSIITAYSATDAAVSICFPGGTTAIHSRHLLVPQWIRLINTVVGASTTRSEGAIGVFTGADPTGGTALTARPARRGSGSGFGSVRAGAVTVPSSTILSRFQIRSAIMVQYEEVMVCFGEQGISPGITLSGTAAQRNVIVVPRLVIGADNADANGFAFHLWNPGNAVTAPSWEVEVCWREIGG